MNQYQAQQARTAAKAASTKMVALWNRLASLTPTRTRHRPVETKQVEAWLVLAIAARDDLDNVIRRLKEASP